MIRKGDCALFSELFTLSPFLPLEAGDSQAASFTKRPPAQPAGLPLTDPMPPLTFLPLVPRSAVGHGGALPSEGLDHGRQERDPPDGDVDRDVYIYGVARTIDENGQCYYFDAGSTWHRCKCRAHIQRIEQSLPRSFIIQALHRGSFVPTIMRLDQQAFNALEQVLRTELGVVLSV